MKAIIPIAILAVTGLVCAQSVTTTPVGYTTVTLKANGFNLVGITMHNPTAAAGIIDSATSNTVVDNDVDFSAVLGTPGAPGSESGDNNPLVYVLELEDGTIQEVTQWSGSTLSVADDITSHITGGTTKYKIRKASTISDIFGASNSAGLTSVDADTLDFATGDAIMIYNGSNFDEYYYLDAEEELGFAGWVDSEYEPSSNRAITYADAFFVRRVAGNDINLVVAGEVKTYATSGLLQPGYNYISGVVPVGLNLENSGLENFITIDTAGDFDLNAIDNIYIQVDNGYAIYVYADVEDVFTGWLNDEFEPVENMGVDGDISKGFLIYNRGAAKAYTLPAPVIAP